MRFWRSASRISKDSSASRECMTLTLQRFAGASFGAQNACHAWTRRCGLLLELQGHGAQGLGEASPLPGYSPDTLEDTETALSALDLRALEHALERPDILDALKAASDLLPVTQPAARMALETAALDWRARREGVSAPALFGAAPQAERTLAWLFPATDAAALHGAQAAGYRHFKLKVGASGELAADLVRVKALARALPAGSRLRLDANRSWSQAEAQRACRELAAIDVEFIEEPCMDMTRPLDTDIAIALDESLLGRRPEQLEALVRQTDARVLVLNTSTSFCLSPGQALRSIWASNASSVNPASWRSKA